MRDLIIAAIRTAIQSAVGFVVAYLADYEILVEADALEGVLFALTVGVVTLLLNWLQTKLPWLGTLLSLGLSKDTPSYNG